MKPRASLWRRHRRGLAAGGAAVLVAIALGTWGLHDLAATNATEERTRAELRSTRAEGHTLSADLNRALTDLAALDVQLTARTAERDQLIEETQLVAGELVAARDALVTAGLQLGERTAAAVQIRECLDGISAGLNALSVGDSGAALARVRAVAGACEAAA